MTDTPDTAETGCCPRFDPAPWDEKEVELTDRLFVKDRVRSFLHIPLNFGRVMVRNMNRIGAAGAGTADQIVISDENSPWGTDVYISVSKEVPGAEMASIPGRFLAKVFEGPFKDIRKWVEAMTSWVESKGSSAKRMLFYYTTCPRCAKVYGKNYVVILAAM